MTQTFTKTDSWTRFAQAKLASATALQHVCIAAEHPAITIEEFERISAEAAAALDRLKHIQDELLLSHTVDAAGTAGIISLKSLPLEHLAEQAKSTGALTAYSITRDQVNLALTDRPVQISHKRARNFLLGLVCGYRAAVP